MLMEMSCGRTVPSRRPGTVRADRRGSRRCGNFDAEVPGAAGIRLPPRLRPSGGFDSVPEMEKLRAAYAWISEPSRRFVPLFLLYLWILTTLSGKIPKHAIDMLLRATAWVDYQLLGIFTDRVGQRAALTGLIVGLIGMTWIFFATDLAWPWFALVGSVGTFAVGLAASYIWPRETAASATQ